MMSGSLKKGRHDGQAQFSGFMRTRLRGEDVMRQTFGALLTILAVTLVCQSTFDLHAQVMPGSLEIKLDMAATMPSRSGPALTLTHADDGSNRIFAGGRNTAS